MGTLVSGIPSIIWGLYRVWKRYGVKAEFRSSAKILIASALAAIPSFFVTTFLQGAAWLQLVLGLVVFLIIYVLGAPVIGVMCQSDIDGLRAMFSDFGIISRMINVPLSIAEKTAKARTNRKALMRP